MTKTASAKKSTASTKKSTASTKKSTASKSAVKQAAAQASAHPTGPAKTARPATTAKTTAKAPVTTEKTPATTDKAPATTPTADDPVVTTMVKPVQTPSSSADPEALPVRHGEEPWTEAELAEIRTELDEEVTRLLEQIENSNAELVGLLRDGSDGAGRDPADVGSTNFERDHEISLANNARELLDQSQLALKHIANGTYGICDNCGQPIGKGRLQAFPRATLCVSCKQREERR